MPTSTNHCGANIADIPAAPIAAPIKPYCNLVFGKILEIFLLTNPGLFSTDVGFLLYVSSFSCFSSSFSDFPSDFFKISSLLKSSF